MQEKTVAVVSLSRFCCFIYVVIVEGVAVVSATSVAFVLVNTTVASLTVTGVSLHTGEGSWCRISEPVFDVVSMS